MASRLSANQYFTEVGVPGTPVQGTKDSDVFSYLAGPQQGRSMSYHPVTFAGAPTAAGLGASAPLALCCDTHSPGAFGGDVPAQNFYGSTDVPVQPISTTELGFLMKAIASFVSELPKLEFGESATRAGRLQTWLGAVGQAVQPAGPHLISWWNWVRQEAEKAHKIFYQ